MGKGNLLDKKQENWGNRGKRAVNKPMVIVDGKQSRFPFPIKIKAFLESYL